MITPGLHPALPVATYRADNDYLSVSALRAALPECYRCAGGPSEALDFGRLFHAVVLEPDRLDERYAVLDPGTVGRRADGSIADNPTATRAWKDAAAEVAASGRTLVSPERWERAHAMRDAVARSSAAAELLFDLPGETMVSAFCASPDGRRYKARYDRLLSGIAVDLTSTSTRPGIDSLARAVVEHGYDLSAAHGLAVGDGLGLALESVVIIFVSKEPPHHRVTVCDLADDFLLRGRVLRALAVERITDPDAEPYEGAGGRLTLPLPSSARVARSSDTTGAVAATTGAEQEERR
ncbi:hypothetical protein [Pimelobacter simplex]|uniref:hypothetical protein n=1 Tax=Nocardioides simplex TaxID=2045 RepID=UPI003AAAC080